MKKISLLCSIFALTLVACQDKYPDLEDGLYAEFITNKGTFVAKLYQDKTPITVANFVDLAQGTNTMVDSAYKGKPFFNGLTFHRVIKDFMIQGGDPLGTGAGNPGYRFPDEFDETLVHDRKGILSMANSGPATNGSQFFITLKETPHLNGRHTIFGEIVVGMDIVDAIGLVPTEPGDKPVDAVIIQEVNIINKGKVKINSFDKEMEVIEKERIATEERIKVVKNETVSSMDSQKENAEELPSGLKIVFLTKGDGVQPKDGDQVLIDYEGYLEDGSLFDSSKLEIAKKYEKVDERREQAGQYTPMPAPYSQDAQLIAGFKEGMLKMKVGDEAILYIPSHLGYGERGAGNVIPPNANLIFKLKITEIAN
ncbi:MAG: peptidylprolyl isomerase [Bacteroidetes bacterium HGW-Bacteroidetes-2]|jgi:peptidylprolyl isomerase|nr:MAG: peptidylprolyl isomerase [Bacteroidetes bacterium HGW-Bacteroidetes-2]